MTDTDVLIIGAGLAAIASPRVQGKAEFLGQGARLVMVTVFGKVL